MYKIGDVVKVQHWVGVITDIASTEGGATMLCVNSLKAVIRNHPPEWLTVVDGQIAPATYEDFRRDTEVHSLRLEQMESAFYALISELETKLQGRGRGARQGR